MTRQGPTAAAATISRRSWLLAALPLALPALAQGFADTPVHLVVPFAPGGATDTVARAFADGLARALKATVIVENKPGGGGSIGVQAVIKRSTDGHNLLLGSNGPIAISPAFQPSLPYRPKRDLLPVAGIASVPFLIVVAPQFPARNMAELIAAANRKPGTVTFASPGEGTTNHMVGELIKVRASVDMTHVPYRGAATAMNDVMGNLVSFMSGDINTLLPMVRAGKLRAIAVTGSKRVPLIPDVPTVAESGIPAFDAQGWFGVFAPVGTPAATMAQLAVASSQAIKEDALVRRVQALGGTVIDSTPAQFSAMVDDETARWQEVLNSNKLLPVERPVK